jgi:hypothetical protein
MDQRGVAEKMLESKPEVRRKVRRPRTRCLEDVENNL